MKKGCLGLLAIVNDTINETVGIENVQVVREFSDVFPEDLLGLPPVREIDFGIDLLPDTHPISIPPYRMTLAELREAICAGFLRNSNVADQANTEKRKVSVDGGIKSMGSLAHIVLAKRLLAKDIQRLEGTSIRISVRNSEALLACAQAKSSLVERIKATRYKDERLCKYRDEALAGKKKDILVESDGVLQMGGRLCVGDVDGLRHDILEEAHNSKYTIHPGSTKMYCDLKQFYWWEVDESNLLGPDLAQEAIDKVQLIRQRLLAAQSKLSPRFIGPYAILDRVGAVAYHLALHPELSFIHPVFHVSMLRKCISDPSLVFEAPAIPLDEKLS
uniref:Uncharacterized protein n=1 Tax=Nicotiana tabacum TaxID=4097 RepID=A0A1S3ZNX3_TOBAC|nr:PREDICTED: uncharacterized protein LOC107788763 [Nicotiana tabacum]